MAIPKKNLKHLFGEKETKKQSPNPRDNLEMKIYRQKIQDLLRNPKMAKKAALIIEYMIKKVK